MAAGYVCTGCAPVWICERAAASQAHHAPYTWSHRPHQYRDAHLDLLPSIEMPRPPPIDRLAGLSPACATCTACHEYKRLATREAAYPPLPAPRPRLQLQPHPSRRRTVHAASQRLAPSVAAPRSFGRSASLLRSQRLAPSVAAPRSFGRSASLTWPSRRRSRSRARP